MHAPSDAAATADLVADPAWFPFSLDLAADEMLFIRLDEAALRPAGARALFLYVPPRAYIETILGGDASRQELAILTPSRIARLARRCPGLVLDPERLGEAQKAAVGWACEMTSLVRSAAAFGRER